MYGLQKKSGNNEKRLIFFDNKGIMVYKSGKGWLMVSDCGEGGAFAAGTFGKCL